MQVVAYLGKGSLEGRRLDMTIRRAAKTRKVILCRTLRALREKLELSRAMDTVVVLLASSRRVLLNLLSLQECFNHLPLIMLVPDAEEKALAKALRLKPIYVTLSGGDFGDVEFILARLLEQAEPSHMCRKE